MFCFYSEKEVLHWLSICKTRKRKKNSKGMVWIINSLARETKREREGSTSADLGQTSRPWESGNGCKFWLVTLISYRLCEQLEYKECSSGTTEHPLLHNLLTYCSMSTYALFLNQNRSPPHCTILASSPAESANRTLVLFVPDKHAGTS